MKIEQIIEDNGGIIKVDDYGQIKVKEWHQTCDICSAEVVNRRVDIKVGWDGWKKCSACKKVYNPDTQKFDMKSVLVLRKSKEK